MKLSYIETNGYDLIVGQCGEEVRCFIYDGGLTDSIVSYLNGSEKVTAALEVLNAIDPENFSDWEGEDYEGKPYTFEALTKGCEIVAEIEC